MPPSPPFKLFIIYAREDQPALLELKAHLRPLEKRGDLTVWYDGEILPGEKWDDAIKAQLEAADIVLLFISKSFFNSEYIEKEELKNALKRHSKGETTVVPVIVKPCLWDAHPEISALQVLPKDGKAVSSWGDADEAWEVVARGLLKLIDRKSSSIEYQVEVAGLMEEEIDKQIKIAIEDYEAGEFEEAFKILHKHIRNPYLLNPRAYALYGRFHYLGICLPINHYAAARWFLKAAEKGDALGQESMGWIYREGDGVEKNTEEAVRWFRLAAEQGSERAKACLKGLGFPE